MEGGLRRNWPVDCILSFFGTEVSGKHNLRRQRRDCVNSRSLCTTACRKQGVFGAWQDTGKQKQRIGRDRKTQLDRDIYQEGDAEIGKDQQTLQPLKRRGGIRERF